MESEWAFDSHQVYFDHDTFIQVAVKVSEADPDNRNGKSDFEGVDVDIANDLFS